MNTYYFGLFSEWRARWFLRLHGYRIIKSRYVTGKNTNRAEIDIIAKHKNTIVFIEVKNHKTIESAWDSIPPIQASRLRRAAETYLIKKHFSGNARLTISSAVNFSVIPYSEEPF